MPLWVDDDFVTSDDLKMIDPEVSGVGDTEGIILDGPNGVIRLAKTRCQSALSRFMSFANFSPKDLAFRDVNFISTIQSLRYNYAGFAQILVSGETETNWGALKLWVVSRSLLEFYRMASNKKADRYSDRLEAMQAEVSAQYWPNFRRRGIPIVMNPLVAPGAIMERCGAFDASAVSLVANVAGTSAEVIEFAATWIGAKYASPTEPHNSESWRSARVRKTLQNGMVARVSIAGLTPPNGQQPDFTKSTCRYSPGTATGWNVWAGHPGKTMYLQNVVPIPIGTTTYTLAGNPTLSGTQLGYGQSEDIVLEISTQLVRG